MAGSTHQPRGAAPPGLGWGPTRGGAVASASAGSNEQIRGRTTQASLAATAGRGQSTSFTGTGWSIHQSYDAKIPAERSAVAARLRIPKDVFERRIDFDFPIPAP